MRLRLVAVLGLLALCLAATPAPDSAVIVNSGSTNFAGYKIEVWPDGTAALTVEDRGGTALTTPKPFTVAKTDATKFFADLATAKSDGAAGSPCMKSASFGSTTRVTWHGWTSPDLSCPPDNAALAALVHDTGVIHTASGISAMPGRRSYGPEMRFVPPSPAPTGT
jgi:hypothetical protein